MGWLLNTMTAFSKQTINHEKSLFQPWLLALCILISKVLCLSREAIMLKLENGATFFFFLQYLYNMHKTLFGWGYLICNIKVTIFVRCTPIADKKCEPRDIKFKTLFTMSFFAVLFHVSHPPNFCFSLFIFSSTRNWWFLLGRKYADFFLIFGLLNIVTTLHNEGE